MATSNRDINVTQNELTEKKTIVIIGKTGVGKCTIANQIFAPKEDTARSAEVRIQIEPPPQKSSLDSATRQATLDRYNTVHTINDQSVQVLVMDTCGLQEIVNIFRVLQRIRDSHNLCAIFLVWKLGRVAREDFEPLNQIIAHLNGLQNITYLIVTGCEGLNPTAQEQTRSTFVNDPATANICSFVGGQDKIILVGFPDLTLVADDTLKANNKESIQQSRETLKEIVLKAKSSQEITETVLAIHLPLYIRIQSWICIIL